MSNSKPSLPLAGAAFVKAFHDNKAKFLAECLEHASLATVIIGMIYKWQTDDGMHDIFADAQSEFDKIKAFELLPLLHRAGFVRKLKPSHKKQADDAEKAKNKPFPYRVTWKGLQFQKLCEFALAFPEPSDVNRSDTGIIAILTFF